MIDVQSRKDHRGIALDHVGVAGLRYPIVVLDQAHGKQKTVAEITMSVNLPHHFKGTHMSRFVEVLNHYHGEITIRTLPKLLHTLRSKLNAESARVKLTFPYFLERKAPQSHAGGLMDFECQFVGEMRGETLDFILGVKVPVTSLCPCSKEISDYGAHNQRGILFIEVRTTLEESGQPRMIWIEELIAVAESSASSPVYPVLKRPDERHVTMQAYDNPVFVEDMARNAAVQLQQDPRIAWFRIHAENFESIHNHSAFASLEQWAKPD
ncbi:GTP cyclohydrolase FolE2 [Holophaga foetida]|uniref:GTP cyclohydrolase FolE2 n=1 Tax=Holophaga foetida TaxID=35839 RepID=UPI0002475031